MSTIIPEDKHRQILATCVDVPEESPSFQLALQRVGISGKTLWVRLAGNKGGHLPFRAKIFLDLDAGRRGIHMSRIEEAITLLHGVTFADLPEYGRLLADRILQTQRSRQVSLELAGNLPHIRQAPVSRLESIDSQEINFSMVLTRNEAGGSGSAEVGAGVHHLTACPCTLSYNEALFNRFNDPWPQATHSQRSKTRLMVRPPDGEQLPTYEVLHEILAGILHISQDLLKRPDETELVLRAHRQPQFAEDVVRQVARAAGITFKSVLPPATRIRVHSLSLESIHIHDVECFLDISLGEILHTMQATEKE